MLLTLYDMHNGMRIPVCRWLVDCTHIRMLNWIRMHLQLHTVFRLGYNAEGCVVRLQLLCCHNSRRVLIAAYNSVLARKCHESTALDCQQSAVLHCTALCSGFCTVLY